MTLRETSVTAMTNEPGPLPRTVARDSVFLRRSNTA